MPAERTAAQNSPHSFDWPSAFFAPRTWVVSRRPPAEEELSVVRALLAAARRPLVIAGGGVRYSEAEAALRRFAGDLRISLAETSAGKGSITASDRLVPAVSSRIWRPT